MSGAAGMHALAVAFPPRIRTNDHWRREHPTLVAKAENSALAKLWAHDDAPVDPFDAAMRPYLEDPFRGSVERRVLAPGESALGLELAAARAALLAAELEADEIDLIVVGSFRPDRIGVGNAAFLARELGTSAAAWNLETACSSSLVAFHTACDLVRAGAYRRVLCVTSCTYSRDIDDADSLSWFLADGAGAFVVAPVAVGTGLLAAHTQTTIDTCDTWRFDVEADGRVHKRSSPDTGRILRASSTRYLRASVDFVLDRAGLRITDIDFFVFNTPTAWFLEFAERALELPPGKAISTYPLYSNIGPALMPVNLHHAASLGRIRPGDRILLYAIGSVSTASAAIVRWSDVALGPSPSRPADAGPAPPIQGG